MKKKRSKKTKEKTITINRLIDVWEQSWGYFVAKNIIHFNQNKSANNETKKNNKIFHLLVITVNVRVCAHEILEEWIRLSVGFFESLSSLLVQVKWELAIFIIAILFSF